MHGVTINFNHEMFVCLHVKYPLFLADCNETWNFLNIFSKNTRVSNFVKICSLGAMLFHADRWPDMMKLTVAYRSFANATKNCDI